MAATLELVFRHRSGRVADAEALCRDVQQVLTDNGVAIRIVIGDRSALDLTSMTEASVGACISVLGQAELFNSLGPSFRSPNQAAIFVVGRIRNALAAASGCAAHPVGRPGAIITETAASASTPASGRWVLAHEIGHLLGLDHVDDTSSLMCDPPTALGFGTPRISIDQRRTMLRQVILGAEGDAPSARPVGIDRPVAPRRVAPPGAAAPPRPIRSRIIIF